MSRISFLQDSFVEYREVTVIIPARNEEHTIGPILDRLLLDFSSDRIMVVVDSSVDHTSLIARQKNVKVLEDKSKGKGSAIRLAIESAESAILVFIDADGSHKPEDIPALIKPILDDRADLVIASRLKGGSEEFSGNMNNIIHYLGNVFASFIVNLAWGRGKKVVTDCNNGFRAIRRAVAKQLDLREDSFAIEQEMTVKCLKRGYRIQEISSYEFKRKHGKSRVNTLTMLPRHIWRFIRDIF